MFQYYSTAWFTYFPAFKSLITVISVGSTRHLALISLCHTRLMTRNQDGCNYQSWSLDRLFPAWTSLGMFLLCWKLTKWQHLQLDVFHKSDWTLRLGLGIWTIALCSSESALTMWESSDVRKGNCNKEEEVEEKQMRLRDEKRDHLFQTLITLLPCSWKRLAFTMIIIVPITNTIYSIFILILMSSDH